LKHLFLKRDFRYLVNFLETAIPIIFTYLTLFFLLVTATENAFSQNYQKGYQLYKKGKLVLADKSLKQALNRKNSANKEAKIYKLLGIIQYTLGKKKLSRKYFEKSLSLNRNIKINKTEVLDEEIVPFFYQVSKIKKETKGRIKRSKSYGANQRKAKSTTILIESKAKGTISIDGILAGNTGSVIEAMPGTAVLTIKAPGYDTKKIRIQIRRNKTNRFKVKLNKLAKKKPKSTKKVNSKVAAKNKKRRRKKSGLFQEIEPKYRDQNSKQRNLVDEFDSDGTYPPPPSAAPPPSAYPPPYQPAYPSYQPPGYYPQYQAPSYQPPYLNPGVATPPPPGYFGENPYGYSTKSSKRRPKKKPAGKDWITYLPLGAGQFQNDSFIFGSLVSGAQIAGVYFFFESQNQAKLYQDAISQLQVNLADENNQNKEGTAQQIKAYRNYVNEQNQLKTICLSMAVGSWIVGAIEANINRKMIPVKTKRNRKYSLQPSPGVEWKLFSTSKDDQSNTPQLKAGYIPTRTPGFYLNLNWTL